MSDSPPTDIVTGAFSYIGKHAARRLLAEGHRVITLTNHPDRPDPFAGAVEARPYRWDDPAALTESLRGAETLYNTYWIRFPRGDATYERAVDNTRALYAAAAEAGLQRLVQVSVTGADPAAWLPYYRGKGLQEEAVRASGLSYAIVRPTLVYGDEDILLNNIAWLLRRLPVFALPGGGSYRLQPVFVEDLADLMAWAGRQTWNLTVDAAGPDIFTFAQLVHLIRASIGSHALVVPAPPGLALALSRAIGGLLRDVMLTRDELAGLMASLLVSDAAPTGKTRLADWLTAHRDTVGRRYAYELARHYRGVSQTT